MADNGQDEQKQKYTVEPINRGPAQGPAVTDAAGYSVEPLNKGATPATSGASNKTAKYTVEPINRAENADPTSPIPENYGFTPRHMAGAAWEGLGNIASGAYGLGKDLLATKTPILIPDEQGVKMSDPNADTLVSKYITRPAAAEHHKAVTAPTDIESIGHSVAEAIPFIGPIAAHIAERAGTGDVGGATAEGATYFVAPKAAEKVVPPIVRGALKRIPLVNEIPDAITAIKDRYIPSRSAKPAPIGLAETLKSTEQAVEPLIKEVEAAKPAPTNPNLVDNSYLPSRSAKPGYKPILPEEPTVEPALKPIGTKSTAEAAPEELKPIGSKVAEPAAVEPAEVRQARHVLGNVAVDKLKTVEGGPEALRRLTTGTYQQFADLANALDIKKPAYLAEKNGEAWQASEFKRTVKEHGKSLSGPKETVVRELLSKPPAEILQHTNPWVDSTAKYPAQMSSLTERTMKALGLTEEAKNNLRASGVSDAQAQSLLAKLTKRQLENLSETMEKGEHLPTVSGGSQRAELSPNASGESAASLENINRVASQKAKGVKTYRLNSLSGQATPILAQDAVDWRPGPAEHKVEVDGEGNISVLESGSRARPVLKSSKIRFPN
jgi:hypothetical protein